MKVSLKSFLQSGELNGLKLGVTQAQVIQALDVPEQFGGTSRQQRRPLIFKYGSLELFFSPSLIGVCESMYIERPMTGTQIQLPSCFEVEEWGLSALADRREVEAYLHTNDISYTVAPQQKGISLMFIISSSGVTIHFDEEDGLLWAISVSRK